MVRLRPGTLKETRSCSVSHFLVVLLYSLYCTDLPALSAIYVQMTQNIFLSMRKTYLYRNVYHMRTDGGVKHGNNPVLRDRRMDAHRALAARRRSTSCGKVDCQLCQQLAQLSQPVNCVNSLSTGTTLQLAPKLTTNAAPSLVSVLCVSCTGSTKYLRHRVGRGTFGLVEGRIVRFLCSALRWTCARNRRVYGDLLSTSHQHRPSVTPILGWRTSSIWVAHTSRANH